MFLYLQHIYYSGIRTSERLPVTWFGAFYFPDHGNLILNKNSSIEGIDFTSRRLLPGIHTTTPLKEQPVQ